MRDRGRLMRVPGTVNGKTGNLCRIVSADLSRPAVEPVELTGNPGVLVELEAERRARRSSSRRDPLADVAPTVTSGSWPGWRSPSPG